ncbi:MAG: mersacidin/lichenicidin family type 2 lantibiotic [Thermomicrobiaceae bacterium]|nr:mersacidin/lichenicidin family type 2 lantibiotic [Thermomicrobiaceae bacterium]
MCKNYERKRMLVIQALKDEEYRMSLTDEERAMLPPSPVGELELTDEELDGLVGALRIVNCSCQCSCHCPSQL